MSARDFIGLIPGYDPFRNADAFYFDETEADRVIAFFEEELTHSKSWFNGRAGDRFLLQPWQKGIEANLFGWKRKRDDSRRYREVLIYLPRKNGKTPIVAGNGVFMLCADGEDGAELSAAAADTDQADKLFWWAKQMVMNNDMLSEECSLFRRSIVYNASSFQVVSSEADTKHGGNLHFASIDELHAQPNRDLVDVLQTSMASRRQPILFLITTADFDRASICNEKYHYACQVRDGIIDDPAFLPVIYEAPRDADFTDPKVWASANPNLGISISEEYLARECEKAKAIPGYENTFRRLHLNQRTEQEHRWISMDKWDACGSDLDAEMWRGQVLRDMKGKWCWAGLDLGSTSDLTALVLAWQTPDGIVAVPWFWVPEYGVHKKDYKYKSLYEGFINRGFVTLTEGDVADYDVIVSDILKLNIDYPIREIAVDRLFQGAQACTQLGNGGLKVIAHGQGFLGMAAPARAFEELVIEGKLKHGNNPVLRWMASNAQVRSDAAGNIKPEKPEKSGPNKIDGIVAAIMATGRLLAEARPQSVYDKRGAIKI